MLVLERTGAIAIWTVSRPEARNALNTATLIDLRRAVEDAGRDGSLRAIVLTGEGKAFVSGGDLRELRGKNAPEDGARLCELGTQVTAGIAALHVPVIAALPGPAIGGGAELAVACDLRIADPRAMLSFKQVRMGVTTAWGALSRLASLCGPSVASRLLLTAHEIGAAEALQIGLVDAVSDPGGCVTTALAWAMDIAAGSPLAVAETKRLLRAALKGDGELHALERERFIATWAGGDHAEAVEAYFEGRAPRWTT